MIVETDNMIITRPSIKPPVLKIVQPVALNENDEKCKRYTLDYIRSEGKKLYNNTLTYDKIENDGKIIPKCICGFSWITIPYIHLRQMKGCPWCKNEAVHVHTFNLSMIKFLSDKINGSIYDFSANTNDIYYKTTSLLTVQCFTKGHKPFTDTVQKILYRGKIKCKKTAGCIECKKELPKPAKRVWYRNIELLKTEGKAMHGDSYSYEYVKPEDIETCMSKINIHCRRITEDGSECGNIFNTILSEHISKGRGCQKCMSSEKITYELFMKRMIQIYPDKFIYDLVKPSDIVNNYSKPKIKCATCDFLIENTTVGGLFQGFRRCDRCANSENWTIEKLLLRMSEKEGIYSYENNIFPLEMIINRNTVLKITCIKCKNNGYENYIFERTIASHFNGDHGCSKCSSMDRWSDYDKLQRKIKELPEAFKSDYDYSHITEELIKTCYAHTEVPIYCKLCNKIFNIALQDHFNRHRGCQCEYKSMGVKVLINVMNQLNIDVTLETICLSPYNTRYYYDFIFQYNNKTYVLEYDGKQHFDSNRMWFKTNEDFINCQKRDIYKQYKALQNNWGVIRIDHTVKYDSFKSHVETALKNNSQVYYSNEKMYDWLEEGVRLMCENNVE